MYKGKDKETYRTRLNKVRFAKSEVYNTLIW
jgi:hypothetical protein